jgi:hypothetical protein
MACLEHGPPRDRPRVRLRLATLELERGDPDGVLLELLAADRAEERLDVGDVIHVLRHAVSTGRTEFAADLLERAGLDERMRPLHEAILVVAEDSADRLLRLAPEVRRVAEDVLAELVGEDETRRLLPSTPARGSAPT